MQQACYQLGLLACPPRRSGPVAHSPAEHAASVSQPRIRTEVVRYVTTISTTLRPSTVATRAKAMLVFLRLPGPTFPTGAADRPDRPSPRRGIPCLGAAASVARTHGRGRTVGLTVYHQDVVDLRCFFEDIAGWGRASAPPRRPLFYSDIPRLPKPLPRALAPDVDRALIAAVARLEDRFVRTG